jgi:glycosyltransferase involved in cell wall biosynthesis
MTDYVKHGVNGYLFEPGNAEDLAQQLKLLTDNPDKVRDLSQRAMRPDDMKAHTRKLLHFYRDAMDICRREQA